MNSTREHEHEQLHDAIRGSRAYWANPSNLYHGEYRAVVNRIFVTVVAALSLLVIYQNYGFIGVLLALAGATLGTLVTLVALWAIFALLSEVLWGIFAFLSEVIPGVFNWLRGR